MRTIGAPPEHLQARVGPAPGFEREGERQMRLLRALARLRRQERLLDIACGVGRTAIPLAGFLSEEGGYDGFDVNAESIEWCREHISRSNFRFEAVDVHDGVYHRVGELDPEQLRFPYDDQMFDIACAFSLFTHMPVMSTIEHYLREAHRVLKPGGRLVSSYFLLNDDSERAIAQRRANPSFEHEVNGYRTTDPENPGLAVAYPEQAVLATLRATGFTVRTVAYGAWAAQVKAGTWNGQDVFVADRLCH
jgi:SAM-dependent methyltransferase